MNDKHLITSAVEPDKIQASPFTPTPNAILKATLGVGKCTSSISGLNR
ncbi:hypothetical protein [Spirosoma pulveris]